MKTIVTYEFPVNLGHEGILLTRLIEVNQFVFEQFGVNSKDAKRSCRESGMMYSSLETQCRIIEIRLEFDNNQQNHETRSGDWRSRFVATQQNVKYYGPGKGFTTSLNWEY